MYNLTPSVIVGSIETPTIESALEFLLESGVDPDWVHVLEGRSALWGD